MLRAIQDKFVAVANNKETVEQRGLLKSVRVSAGMYECFRQLYRDCVDFLDQIDRVLEDGEHRLFLEEGRILKYNMPDEAEFREKMTLFRHQLDSYDPGLILARDRQSVLLPYSTTAGFHGTAVYCCDFLQDYLDALVKTDYMKYMREIKKKGCPYVGPHSLLEAWNTHIDLQIASAMTSQEANPPRLPPNWTQRHLGT